MGVVGVVGVVGWLSRRLDKWRMGERLEDAATTRSSTTTATSMPEQQQRQQPNDNYEDSSNKNTRERLATRPDSLQLIPKYKQIEKETN